MQRVNPWRADRGYVKAFPTGFFISLMFSSVGSDRWPGHRLPERSCRPGGMLTTQARAARRRWTFASPSAIERPVPVGLSASRLFSVAHQTRGTIGTLTCSKRNLTRLDATLSVGVTLTRAERVPTGTTKVIAVSVQDVVVTAAAPNVTTPAVPKLLPLIVTIVPTTPWLGDNEVMTGALMTGTAVTT